MRVTEFSELEYVPTDLVEIHNLLMAWATWAQARHHNQTCGSAEKYYQAPWRQWVPLSEINLQAGDKLPDHIAMSIERAVTGIPERNRKVIRLWYVKRSRPGFIRAAAGCPFAELPQFINDSRRMVRNRLQAKR